MNMKQSIVLTGLLCLFTGCADRPVGESTHAVTSDETTGISSAGAVAVCLDGSPQTAALGGSTSGLPDMTSTACDPSDPNYPNVIQDGSTPDTYLVEDCGPVCDGFPIPPVDQWDPDGICGGGPDGSVPPVCDPECTPQHVSFLGWFGRKKCPDDVPAADRWLYDACLAVSTASAFDTACKIMPPPVDKVCKAAAAGGKAACCKAVLDTKVPPTWKCAFQEAAKPAPSALACANCCDANWPVLGTTNVDLNNACKNSCTRAGAVGGW